MNLDFPELRKLLAAGTGVGIEIEDDVLRVAVVRARPTGARLLGAATINGFRERTAAAWGAVCTDFLKRTGASHLAATVLLPRRDVIVRLLTLPGVRPSGISRSAIQFQIDSMHPFPEDQAAYAWSRLGASGAVLVAITRKDTLERYLGLFSEAGVKVAAFTFSAAVLYSACPASGAAPGGRFSGLRPGWGRSGSLWRERSPPVVLRGLRFAAGPGRRLWPARNCASIPAYEPMDAAALLPSPAGALPISISPATHWRTRRRWPGPAPGWRCR